MIDCEVGPIKVSVIIPVYRVEQYIERCVRSLMNQTLKEIEFIFVDDCSPDSSIDRLEYVLRDYPQRKYSIKIIRNTVNKGLSESRRIGIEHAIGSFIATCDSDDWVEPDMYERLYMSVEKENADIAVCNYYQEFCGGHKEWRFDYSTNTHLCLSQIHDNHRFSWNVWNHLIRRDIYKKAINEVFPTTYAEDIYSMIYAYWFADKVIHVPLPLYHYNQCNNLSVMSLRSWPDGIWKQQQRNIDAIVRMIELENNPQYRLACQWLKYKVKEKLRSAFPSLRAYYDAYKECHSDILSYGYISRNVRYKLALIYSCYPSFWLYHKLKS